MASVADSGGSGAARSTAALLATLAGAFVALGFPPVGLPLAAAGLAWLYARRGIAGATFAAVVAGASTFIVDPSGPLYVTLWLLAAGPLAVSMLKRARFESAVLAVTVAVAVVWAGAIIGSAAAQGTDVASMMRAATKEAMSTSMLKAGGAAADDTEVTRQVEELSSMMVRLLPAVLAFLAGVAAVAVIGAAVVVLRLQDVEIRPVPALKEFDLDPRVVWALIVAVLAIAADKFSGGWNNGMLGVIGENLLLTMRWVLFAQGIAVFAGLYEKSKVPKAGRAFGYAALALTEAVLPLVSLTGLIDVWLNIRKLPRDGRTDTRVSDG